MRVLQATQQSMGHPSARTSSSSRSSARRRARCFSRITAALPYSCSCQATSVLRFSCASACQPAAHMSLSWRLRKLLNGAHMVNS